MLTKPAMCRWCRGQVDPRAKFCPHCGQVLKGARTLTVVLLILLGISVIVVLGGLNRAGVFDDLYNAHTKATHR